MCKTDLIDNLGDSDNFFDEEPHRKLRRQKLAKALVHLNLANHALYDSKSKERSFINPDKCTREKAARKRRPERKIEARLKKTIINSIVDAQRPDIEENAKQIQKDLQIQAPIQIEEQIQGNLL